jgi:putative ABC transport system substrate-binding protein
MRLLAALLLAPLLAFAAAPVQAQDKLRRIGILSPVAQGDAQARAQFGMFTARLRELGYVEGKTLAIEWAYAEGRYERLPVLAGELVKAGSEVIITQGTPATTAAKRATGTLPIVAVSFGDPVASGFARSLARPGGNITGFSTMGSVVYEQRLELLLEVVPEAKRVGLMVNPDNAFYMRVLPGLQALAQKQGRSLLVVNVKDAKSLQEGFGRLVTGRVGAVLVGDDNYLSTQAGAIAGLAVKHKLPTLFAQRRGVDEGGLLSYANDGNFRYQSAAVYVDRILKGAKAGDLPIVQPTKFELVVNKKTAEALGIVLPQSILARAKLIN